MQQGSTMKRWAVALLLVVAAGLASVHAQFDGQMGMGQFGQQDDDQQFGPQFDTNQGQFGAPNANPGQFSGQFDMNQGQFDGQIPMNQQQFDAQPTTPGQFADPASQGTSLVETCGRGNSDSLAANYPNCQWVDDVKRPRKAYYFTVDDFAEGENDPGFDLQITIRFVKGQVNMTMNGPKGWNLTELCGAGLTKCVYYDETSILMYLDRSMLSPGTYWLFVSTPSYASYSIRVETPSAIPVLDNGDKKALASVAQDCCPAGFTSDVCRMLTAGLKADAKPEDDICRQRPNVCNNAGNVVKLVLRGWSGAGGKVEPGLKCRRFPRALELLTRLETLDITNNLLGVNIRDVSAVTSRMPFLTRLIARNNRFVGSFPCDIITENLMSIWLDYNELSGLVPTCIFKSRTLQLLSLNGNAFNGPIPALPQSSNLTMLQLGNPKPGAGLTGPIPPSISQLEMLWSLDLSGNKLSGTIPDLPLNIQLLNLENNALEGELPAVLASGPFLASVQLGGNKLSGALPRGAITSPNLVELDLHNNAIESRLENFDLSPSARVLMFLDISGNKLFGGIPSYLSALPSLINVNLANNALDGSLGLFAAMLPQTSQLQVLNISNNRLEGNIPEELVNLAVFEEDGRTYKVLDLSNNDLDGPFPVWMLDKLQPGVQVINLSGNRLGCPAAITQKLEPTTKKNIMAFPQLTCVAPKLKKEVSVLDALEGILPLGIKGAILPRKLDPTSKAAAAKPVAPKEDPKPAPKEDPKPPPKVVQRSFTIRPKEKEPAATKEEKPAPQTVSGAVKPHHSTKHDTTAEDKPHTVQQTRHTPLPVSEPETKTKKPEDTPPTTAAKDGTVTQSVSGTVQSNNEPKATPDQTDKAATASGSEATNAQPGSIQTNHVPQGVPTKPIVDTTATAPQKSEDKGLSKQDKFGIGLAVVLGVVLLAVLLGVIIRETRCKPKAKERKYNLYEDALATV